MTTNTFADGYFDKMAQEGISPADARRIADLVVLQTEKRRRMHAESPLRRILETIGGAGKGALAGAGVAAGAAYANRFANKRPLANGAALDQALAFARLGLVPGAFIGGVVGAVK